MTPSLDIQGGIATICLNRPQHRHRLHRDDLDAMLAHLEAVNANAAVRVLVLAAQPVQGTLESVGQAAVFSAGFHLGEFDAATTPQHFEHVANALEAARPITLCALSGSVYGGATDLVLACDLALGTPDLEWRMPAASLGLHYYPSGLRRAKSRMGQSHAKRAFLTAQALSATELHHMGVLHQIVAAPAFQSAVHTLAQHLASLAPLAAQGMKASLSDHATAEQMAQRTLACQRSQDLQEGLMAQRERRPAVFCGA